MAFVSVVTGGRGRKRDEAGISIKYSQSGSVQCYVGVDIRDKQRFIYVELDEDSRKIRLMPTNNERGAKMSGISGGTFSLSKKFGEMIIPSGEKKAFIRLEKNGDGWWYGELIAKNIN